MSSSHSSVYVSATSEASGSAAGAIRALTLELKSLQTSPLEGFTVNPSESDIFVWTVAIFGPPGTLYQVILGFKVSFERNFYLCQNPAKFYFVSNLRVDISKP